MPHDAEIECPAAGATGMALSLLSEISDRLQRLHQSGESSAIDLLGLPLTAPDRTEIDELLGRGEICATLDLAGTSEVWETRYPGVWRIRHRGAGDRVACEEIAITRIPDILSTHPADIARASGRIGADLASLSHGADQQPEASDA